MDQQGDGGGHWTGDRVEARLIAAFRALPNHPIFSSRAGIASALGNAPGDVTALAWPARFVADPAGRIALLTWARCKATKISSFGEICREMGWPRNTAEDRRRYAARVIADALNS